MQSDNVASPPKYHHQPVLSVAYLKLGAAVLVGVALVLVVYYMVFQDKTGTQGLQQALVVCRCPVCGTTVQKPAGMDCEELSCPKDGQVMKSATMLVATAPLTQNRRETLAERGVVTPGPLSQNQRETLAEQGIPIPRNQTRAAAPGTAGRLVAIPPAYSQPTNPGICVCPRCGQKLARYPGVTCSQMRCPACGSPMTNAIYVGQANQIRNQAIATPQAPRLVGIPAAAPCPAGPGGGGTPPCAQAGGGGGGRAQGTQPQHSPTSPCPQPGTQATHPAQTTGAVTYANTVQGIVAANCLRCHGGPIRNLSTYNHIKAYADNGLLMMMIQPGGPMSRFLSADQAQLIVSWIKAGTPP